MKKILAMIGALGMVALSAQAQTPVFSDNFNSVTKNINWNIGGGYLLNGSTLELTNFGGNFAEFSSGNGVAGLNAAAGAVSFTVAPVGASLLGFNFSVGTTDVYNNEQLGGFALSGPAAGNIEMVWNNTGSNLSYSLPSGASGTIAGNNNFVVYNNGVLWGTNPQTGAGTFTHGTGIAANAFGFWNPNNQNPAIIDNFKIYNTLNVATNTPPPPPPPEATPVFSDNFNSVTKNAAWDTGGGYLLNGSTLELTNFGGTFAEFSSGNGVVGLNAAAGAVSLTVAQVGASLLGFNFSVGATDAYTQDQLAGFALAGPGAGHIEMVWNNTGSNLSYSLPSGAAGTIAGNRNFVVFNNGVLWGTDPQTGAGTVGIGVPANAFGFWNGNNQNPAIIDDFKIYNTLNVVTNTTPSPSLLISKSGSNMVLNWLGTGFKLQYQTNSLSMGLSTNWMDYALPAGTNPPVTVPISAVAGFFRLSQ